MYTKQSLGEIDRGADIGDLREASMDNEEQLIVEKVAS